MRVLSAEVIAANRWWNGLSYEHQKKLNEILKLNARDCTAYFTVPKADLLRAYHQCPNKDYKD